MAGPVSRSFLICGLGEVLWDIFPEKRMPGGAPANTVYHAVKTGMKGALISAVGTDEAGESLARRLAGDQIDVSCVQRNTKPTGSVYVRLNKQGIPNFRCSFDTAFDHLNRTAEAEAMLKNADAVITGTLAQRTARNFNPVQELLNSAKGKVVLFDPNIRGMDAHTRHIIQATLQSASVLKINKQELEIFKSVFTLKTDEKDAVKQLLNQFGLEVIILTKGADGCMLYNGMEWASHPGFKIKAVDTTGCGDAFSAAFLFQYLNGASLDFIARYANAFSAFKALLPGAMPEYEIETFNLFYKTILNNE